jgi:trehalose/maltose transport system substrate-binding protein
MQRFTPALLTLLLLGSTSAPMPATLTLVCGANPQIHAFCRAAAEEWAAANGHSVRVAAAPADVQDRLRIYEELLGVADPELDVLEIDVTWPGVLGAELIDLTPFLDDAEQGIMPALLASNRVGGRLLAMPWYLDFGVLFYREDLLEAAGVTVPEDWDAFEAAALAVQQAQREAGNGRFWGFVWQGWRSEALVCNALEWLAGHGAGRIIDVDGTVSVDTAAAVAALERPSAWLNGISPPSVLSFSEDESLAVFAEGNAAFLRHWPGAWATLNADDARLAGKVGVAPLPKLPDHSRHPATLGGWQLAVSRHSRNPALAAALVQHLTSPAVQRRLALELNMLPTRSTLYQDPEVQAALPVSPMLAARQVELVPRPSAALGPQYPQASRLVQETLFNLLSGSGDADVALPRLAQQLRRLIASGELARSAP